MDGWNIMKNVEKLTDEITKQKYNSKKLIKADG